jgi:hypothetical protein
MAPVEDKQTFWNQRVSIWPCMAVHHIISAPLPKPKAAGKTIASSTG